MKNSSTIPAGRRAGERGNIIIWCFIMVTVVTVSGGVAMLVAQTSNLTRSRGNLIQARQYAQSAVVIACNDMNNAMTATNGMTFAYNMQHGSYPYTAVSNTVYQRVVAAPFSNQTATVTITLSSASSPSTAAITGTATAGNVTQTATAYVRMAWAYPGAIIDVNAGTTSTSNAKPSGQAGNVAVNGNGGAPGTGPIVIYNSSGPAVMANGMVDIDSNYVKGQTYSMTNWGTANQLPDYTSQGTSNALFDLGRLIAVADLTPNGYNPATGNNHFTNVTSFATAMVKHTNSATAMQGVIVVDLNQNDSDLGNLTDDAVKMTMATDKKTGISTTNNTGGLPFGMNVKGTLLFNFTGPGWDPVTEKVIVTAAFNVNAADLSHLVATNPATYATGYPPTYTDSTKNPVNIDITSKGYQNFSAGDDLPALIYSTGCLDMHGNADVCGVLYTPCYVELENKQDSQIQYFNGCVICGHGMYYENNKASTSIIAFDNNTVDSLTTWGNVGKQLLISYWSK